MSQEDDGPKEWFRVNHAANGATSVTCSVQDGNLSVKWTVKTYSPQVKSAVKEARLYAFKSLEDLKDAIKELAE